VLVFTRKLDEGIVIGDGIEVRVLRVGRGTVRLGVIAARHVPIHRREIYDLIRDANASAAAGASQVNRLVERLRRTAERIRPRP